MRKQVTFCVITIFYLFISQNNFCRTTVYIHTASLYRVVRICMTYGKIYGLVVNISQPDLFSGSFNPNLLQICLHYLCSCVHFLPVFLSSLLTRTPHTYYTSADTHSHTAFSPQLQCPLGQPGMTSLVEGCPSMARLQKSFQSASWSTIQEKGRKGVKKKCTLGQNMKMNNSTIKKWQNKQCDIHKNLHLDTYRHLDVLTRFK